MSKYENITAFLAERDYSKPWHATFQQVEELIGSSLPDSARKHQAWWANQAGKGHAQSFSWACVGWRTSNLDLENETVTFRPLTKDEIMAGKRKREEAKHVANSGMSIDDAKSGLAKTFGVQPDQIEITIRG